VNPARWQQLKSVFDQALQLDPSQRPGYIDEVCALDPELRKEIESMLAAHEQVREEFLNTPAAGLDAFQDLSGADPSVGKHIGPYQLVRELGSGGMGEVYLAVRADAEFHKEVAVKLIRSGQDSAAVVSRFKIERQILASLDHPNIAKLLDGGRTLQGQPYFVMEYVSGVPITDYCDEKKLKIRERLDLFIQVCEGVQYAHQNAIIHRDLKPANILVAEVDGKPIPRIIDFGLAKATTRTLPEHTQLTRFGHLMGTPDYMSPEQADPRGRNIDTRTDVYSLGVVLYVLLTGLLPFATKRHENPPLDEFLRRLREEEPPRASAKVSADRDSSAVSALARGVEPQQLVKLLRGDLDWITMKALERDRDRRYGSPSDLAADLRRYLNHEPVVARPASAAYQIGKFVRRHRFAAGFIGMVTVLSAVASAAALVAFHQKHEAQFQEMQALQAQSRLLTQAAAQRLKDTDSAGAQGIILEVLTNPRFASVRTPAANSVFQDIRAADVQLEVLSGHGDSVLSAAYSPDGSRIVTASIDKTARIWDAHTGVQLAVLSGHGEEVSCAAYSPDGTRIITAAADKTARIWDASTGAQLAVLSGHKEGLSCAAYSPDGSRIVTASNDKTARIWDARTGVQLAALSGHGGRVFHAAYSPDGARIVTASFDKTARIWDAHVPADLAAQILWVASAVTDPLPDTDRTQLGLPPDSRARLVWPTEASACDQAAAAVYDPDRLTRGAVLQTITVDIAGSACSAETAKPEHAARADYQMGRTLLAKGDSNSARRQFEIAVAKRYRSARIDLGDLLVDASTEKGDPGRAVSLYEQAWQEGVPIAAFKLGHLFEYGVQSADAAAGVFNTDAAKAWSWYQKGVDAGEPNAVARFAERDERNALAQTDPLKRNAQLLQAFALYAAAAERAREEDWPDGAWKGWRYRRATLARLLAQQGMMQQVADAYGATLDKPRARAAGIIAAD
jgi:TPR repeat protein